MFAIDHLAFPCFDLEATLRFYTEVLGGSLRHALPKDIRHAALAVATRADVLRFKERFERAAVPFWTETHDVDDVHVYASDPNGVTLEIVAQEDSVRSRRADPEGAQRVVARWVAARG